MLTQLKKLKKMGPFQTTSINSNFFTLQHPPPPSPYLYVFLNLQNRKIVAESKCQICQQEDETMLHALWSCPLARNVWALVRDKIQKWPNDIVTALFGLFNRACMECNIEEAEIWAMLYEPYIWNAKNKYYFENT